MRVAGLSKPQLALHLHIDLVFVFRVANAQHAVLHDARAPLAQVGVGHAQEQLEGAVAPAVVSMAVGGRGRASMSIASRAEIAGRSRVQEACSGVPP